MRAVAVLPVFAAAVFAQSESAAAPSVSLEFPQTTFLTQTNSRGVVTGQPAVETNQPGQPPADTSIPPVETNVGTAATIPAVGTGIVTLLLPGTAGPNSTQTVVVSANNSTTIVLGNGGAEPTASVTGTGTEAPEATETGADSTGTETGTATGTVSGTATPDETGAAANLRAVAGSVVGLGAFVAAFL